MNEYITYCQLFNIPIRQMYSSFLSTLICMYIVNYVEKKIKKKSIFDDPTTQKYL